MGLRETKQMLTVAVYQVLVLLFGNTIHHATPYPLFQLLTIDTNSILGEVTPERVEMVRQADHIFISMIREWGLYDKISQAFAALDTSKAVGVMVSTSLHKCVDLISEAN